MKHTESKIQSACVNEFRRLFPKYAMVLFAIPNGGARDAKTGYWLKQEGVIAGVPDLLLAVPKGKYASLYIEIKSPIGRQTKEQILMQVELEHHGNKYVICRNVEQFIEEIQNYLSQ